MEPTAPPESPLPPSPQVPQTEVSAPLQEPGSKKPIMVIISIIILVLLAAGFYYFIFMQKNTVSKIPVPAETPKNQKVIVSVAPESSTTANLDNSDTQLDKDIQAINNKANNLAVDVNNVDKGLNDTPIDNGL